jgi:hypothetical protein
VQNNKHCLLKIHKVHNVPFVHTVHKVREVATGLQKIKLDAQKEDLGTGNVSCPEGAENGKVM